MEQQRFPREIIDFLSEKVADTVDPTILMRGLNYFEDGRVQNVHMNHSMIEATVRGTNMYTVEIDSNFFSMSTCTCPYDGFCKHIVATFFAIYDVYGSPRAWVRDHKKKHTANSVSSPKRSGITSFEPEFVQSRMPIRKSRRYETIETPQENDSIFGWHRNFEQNYSNQQNIHSSSEMRTYFERMRQDLLGYAKNWSKDKQFFYELHVLLFLNDQIFKFRSSRSNTRLYGWYFEEEISELSSHYLSILNTFLQSKASKDSPIETEDQLLHDTKEFLHSLVTPLGVVFSSLDLMRLHMYRLTWLFLLGENQKFVQMEIDYLKQQFKHTSHNEKQELISLALVFFDSISGNDKEAMQRLSQLPNLTVDHCLFNLLYHEQNEHWDDLLLWLRWLQKNSVHENKNQLIYKLSYFWEKVSEHTNSDNEWVESLKQSLPESFPYYADYLISTNRIREWINALLYYQIPLEDVEKEHIKAVESQDIQLLLPLFHQAVERLIQEKNRESYKQAVRYLKTLQRYYKKLKQMNRWDLYIHVFTQKYSRLRALHEELKKGKFIE